MAFALRFVYSQYLPWLSSWVILELLILRAGRKSGLSPSAALVLTGCLTQLSIVLLQH